MPKLCHRNIWVAYLKHRPAPEDLLNFIESPDFTADWEALGLDDEDDLTSLQFCIMAGHCRDPLVRGTKGLRVHRHRFDGPPCKTVCVYYAYFAGFGIVYLNCVVASKSRPRFSDEDIVAFNAAVAEVETELERLRTIRVTGKPRR